jgi:hypothetical protein
MTSLTALLSKWPLIRQIPERADGTGLSADAQKAQIVCWTRRSAAGNALMLQVRPESDAFYPSRLQVSKTARFAICLSQQNCRVHLEEWFASWKASKACGCGGVGESTSRDRRSSLLAGTARRLATRHSRTHPARLPARAVAGYFRAPSAAYGRYAPSQRARSQPARRPGAPGP